MNKQYYILAHNIYDGMITDIERDSDAIILQRFNIMEREYQFILYNHSGYINTIYNIKNITLIELINKLDNIEYYSDPVKWMKTHFNYIRNEKIRILID